MVGLGRWLAVAWCAVAGAQEPVVLDEALEEISGLARSLSDPEVLWAHNDGGNATELFRLDAGGRGLGVLKLPGGSLRDWEDIASFRWQGQPALLLADVGDNFGAFGHATLYAVQDPARGAAAELLWALEFRYPDGARDCEAVAVDPAGEILLLTKRDRPPRLYRLPLPQRLPAQPQIAEFLGEVRSLAAPAAAAAGRAGWLRARYLDMPTALDISADGRRAVIVTPAAAFVYARGPRQTWLQALNGAPRRIELPRLPQIEAGAFSADGRTLYIASEGAPPTFARIALPD